MNRSAEARRKILNVATAIEAEPQRYRQEWWAAIPVDNLPAEGLTVDPSACGTAFCIAGWNHLLHHGTDDWLEVGYYHRVDDGDWQKLNWCMNGFDMTEETLRDFELGAEGELLISSYWRPISGVSVPEALRLLAYGASVHDITAYDVIERWA